MVFANASEPTLPDRGARIALIVTLVAERLALFYEHGQWLTVAQGASLVAGWLTRSKRSLSLSERKHLSALSDQLARQMAESLSREAGLYTAHEMMEALDPNYPSELGMSMMHECERVFEAGVSD